jgi:hypothetical protein
MSASKVFYSLLSNNAPTTGVVGANIYPQQAPQTTTFPFIVITQVSNVPNNTKSGVSTMDTMRVQVTMIHNTQALLDTLGGYVRTALDFVNNQTIQGVKVQYITYQGESDAFDEGAGQDGAFLKYQDYLLTISR